MGTAGFIRQDLLTEATRRLAAEFNPEQVWLFGSHAWGEPDEGSDLDLMVVVGTARKARRVRPSGLIGACKGWRFPRT